MNTGVEIYIFSGQWYSMPKVLLLKEYSGKVNAIRDGIAYLSLNDETGGYNAAIEVSKLRLYNPREGMLFMMRITKNRGKVFLHVESKPRKELSPEESRKIVQKIDREIGDYNPAKGP